MVFNTTVNNISVISWRSVLLVEKTGVFGENHCRKSPTNFITVSFYDDYWSDTSDSSCMVLKLFSKSSFEDPNFLFFQSKILIFSTFTPGYLLDHKIFCFSFGDPEVYFKGFKHGWGPKLWNQLNMGLLYSYKKIIESRIQS